MRSPSPFTRRLALAGLALTVALTAAACGDDDGDDAASETRDSVLASDAGLPAEACDAYAAFSAAMVGDPAAMADAGSQLTAALPDTLADQGAAIEQALATGDEAALGSPEVTGALAEVGDAVYDGCEADAQLDVTGIDYGFEDLPEQVDAGRVAIRFTNGSEAGEPHEMVLMRRNEGVTESVEELMALPEDQVMQKLTMAGVVFADAPGTSSVLLTDLEPGNYVAICMIPVGGGEQGPPHAAHGMVTELEVA
jgi:hypothetical protein